MKYVFMNATLRAMGNAFKVYDPHHNCYVVMLCDSGEMGVFKALDSHGWYTRNIRRINNVEADKLQREGARFIRIHEE